jgi:hypothetical protein
MKSYALLRDLLCLLSCKRLQQQEAALQVQVAHLTLQNMELRRELGSGWSAAEPSVMQVHNTNSACMRGSKFASA